MSKLGKKPINIPKDTKVKVESGKVILTGPKGTKELSITNLQDAEIGGVFRAGSTLTRGEQENG